MLATSVAGSEAPSVIVTGLPPTVIGPEQRPPSTLNEEPPDTEYVNGLPAIPLVADLQISITPADAAWAPAARIAPAATSTTATRTRISPSFESRPRDCP